MRDSTSCWLTFVLIFCFIDTLTSVLLIYYNTHYYTPSQQYGLQPLSNMHTNGSIDSDVYGLYAQSSGYGDGVYGALAGDTSGAGPGDGDAGGGASLTSFSVFSTPSFALASIPASMLSFFTVLYTAVLCACRWVLETGMQAYPLLTFRYTRLVRPYFFVRSNRLLKRAFVNVQTVTTKIVWLLTLIFLYIGLFSCAGFVLFSKIDQQYFGDMVSTCTS